MSNFTKLQQIIPSVSHETYDDLCQYQQLVAKWQPHINLIANSTLPDIWTRHILDSAQIYPLASAANNWLDLGSGGGFPALVIACFLKQKNKAENTYTKINLIESNGKKVSFLRQVIHQLQLPAQVHLGRIETKISEIVNPEIITARALASLNTLFDLFAPLFSNETVVPPTAYIQKGKSYLQEINEAKQKWDFDYRVLPSSVNSDSVILEIKKIRHRGIS